MRLPDKKGLPIYHGKGGMLFIKQKGFLVHDGALFLTKQKGLCVYYGKWGMFLARQKGFPIYQ